MSFATDSCWHWSCWLAGDKPHRSALVKQPCDVSPCLQEDANAAKSSLRVLVNVGKAEVELVRTSQEGSSDRDPLARFMIGGLWVSYRMTYGGESLALELFAFIRSTSA